MTDTATGTIVASHFSTETSTNNGGMYLFAFGIVNPSEMNDSFSHLFVKGIYHGSNGHSVGALLNVFQKNGNLVNVVFGSQVVADAEPST